jgi:hypothetical protein
MSGLTKETAQQFCLTFDMNLQRRTFGGPDRRILLCRPSRPDLEDDAVQNQPPERAWDLDDPRVGEELAKVAAYGLCRRRGWCPQIDQQNGGQRRRTMAVGWLREIAWHQQLAW